VKLKNLEMFENNFTGPIQTEFGMLHNVEYMWAYTSAFPGTIWTEVGFCTDIIHFAVNCNLLTGRIPTELSQHRKLEWLGLKSNS
jgi:hypothetical protein